jgi:hypothetical protein
MTTKRALSAIILGAIFGCVGMWLFRATPESSLPNFAPHPVGQSAWFRTVASGITGNIAESAATPFLSETGIIQIAVIVNSGSASGGTITVYSQVKQGDAVYVAVPSATYGLMASSSAISDTIVVGTGYHKLVVSGASGTFNFDLAVRDF